jgi:hypothetical protein
MGAKVTVVASKAAKQLASYLQGDGGLPSAVAALAANSEFELPAIEPEQIQLRHAGIEVLEKALAFKYPQVLVYQEKIRNELKEKFRRFSGTVEVVVEIRLSEERLEDLEGKLNAYVDAVAEILWARRGEWSPGVCYGGAYEVAIEAVKKGGANFVQRARVVAPVHVSVS